MINQKYFYTTEGIEPERIVTYNWKKISLMRGKKISPVPTLEEIDKIVTKYTNLYQKFQKLKERAENESSTLKQWIKKNIDNDKK